MAHHLVNHSNQPVVYLEVGDRTVGDAANCPNDDIVATFTNEQWVFTCKDGAPYPTDDSP